MGSRWDLDGRGAVLKSRQRSNPRTQQVPCRARLRRVGDPFWRDGAGSGMNELGKSLCAALAVVGRGQHMSNVRDWPIVSSSLHFKLPNDKQNVKAGCHALIEGHFLCPPFFGWFSPHPYYLACVFDHLV